MTNIKSILENLIGEWSPIASGEHFAGIDFQWLAAALICAVVLFGLLGVTRACIRR